MRKLLAAAVLAFGAVLVACGGGGGGTSFKDPNSVHFTYGSPYTPTTGSPEAGAVAAGQSGVSGSSAIRTQGAADDQAAGQVVELPNAMAQEAFGWSGGFSRSVDAAKAAVARRAAAYLAGDVAAATSDWDNPNCWAVTAAKVSFDHCTQTQHPSATETDVFSVDGSLNRDAGRVWWDVTVSMSASDSGSSLRIDASDRVSGDLTFGTGTVAGFEQSDLYLHASDASHSVTAAVTYRADLDAITYTTDPAVCATGVTGGKLTLKRVWTTIPSGTDLDPDVLTDRALRFTWLDCGLVQVEVGTP